MSNRPIRRVRTGDRLGDDAQKSAQESAARLNAQIFDGGKLLDAEIGKPPRSGLAFAAGTARAIAHGLGRKAVGWLEVYGVDTPSAAHVGLRATAMPGGISSDTHVALTPAATGTCFLFVF